MLALPETFRRHSYTNSGKDLKAKYILEKELLQRPSSGGSGFIIMVGLPSREGGLQRRLYGSAHIIIAPVKASTVFLCILCLQESTPAKRHHERKRQEQRQSKQDVEPWPPLTSYGLGKLEC